MRFGFFAWEASWGRILTLDRLRRRGVPLVNRCFMCKREEESIDHLFLHCVTAGYLWQLFFSLFGLQRVMHSSVRLMLLSQSGIQVGKKQKKVWLAAPLCLFWIIWCERNQRLLKMWKLQIKRLNLLFCFPFWTMLGFTQKEILSLFDFIDWVGAKQLWVGGIVCAPLFLCFPLGSLCMLLVYVDGLQPIIHL